MNPRLHVFTALVLLACVSRAGAVILYESPTRNTDPPGSLSNRDPWTGPQGADDPRRLLNSGWQYEGEWGGFLGAPISSQYFVTAKHVGSGGQNPSSPDPYNFTYRGVTYHVTDHNLHYDSPNSDLSIWKIDETFPVNSAAPLYQGSDETSKSLVAIGRGVQRGGEVRVSGVLKGWMNGAVDNVQSWGENVVTGTFDGGSGFGQVLYFDFDAGAGTNEASLANFDSGGGIWIQEGGVWKLAGINLTTDGPWGFTSDYNNTFFASIFDAYGLYTYIGGTDPEDWQQVNVHVPGASYATRISANLSWIESITGPLPAAALVPEPSTLAGVSLLSGVLIRRRDRSKRQTR